MSDAAPTTILIVDDDPTLLRLLGIVMLAVGIGLPAVYARRRTRNIDRNSLGQSELKHA